jgi:nucleotide-binding universal stress UspA family protein
MEILLTTDGSPQATTALRTASRLFRKEAWQADVLCVAPKPDWPTPQGKPLKPKVVQMHEQYQHQIKLEARKVLTQAQALLAAEGVAAAPLVEVGSPTNVILRLANNYDVVVLGAHDKYARSQPGLGPVANRVIAQFPSAVLVAREMSVDRGIRVLVGADGSPAAEQALRLLARYFNTEAAEITLLHVVETPWLKLGLERDWFGGVTGQSDPAQRFDRALRAEAEEVLESARALLEESGLSAQTMVENGDPALELLSEAENGAYDLIVLGASSEAETQHSLLGSVSTRVAQDAPCSVFVAKFVE